MYNNSNRNSSSRFGRNNNNNSQSHGGGFSRFGGSRSNGPRRGGNGGGRGRFGGKAINPALFVNKATEITTIEETQTVNTFADFKLNPSLMANVVTKGYIKPTPIQDQVIPLIMEDRDVLGIANTGTGKTAAFVLPLIHKILNNPNRRIIILAPTRELAQQIKQEIRSFTPGLRVYIALAIGGSFIREQIIDIRRGPHIIIGTPGRIKDLGQRRVINFSTLDTLVLDEVDRMLDMGFIDDIRSIVDQIPKTRQTLFFSATTTPRIELLINTFLNNPARVSVKTQDTSSHVEQDVVRVARANKEEALHQLLAQPQFKKVLIFGATKMMVEKVSVNLVNRGFNAASIHGDKPQNKRQRVLQAFKSSEIKILVATDVAARGLDIADISHVINYDQPANYDDYIHRIGRTGRGDSKGFALTFVESQY
ncbi:MAG: DEAD/DEAH box helicase [Candidatus Shapirobacteria bacterium]